MPKRALARSDQQSKFLLGSISGTVFFIPGLCVWLYVLPYLLTETHTIKDTFEFIYFLFGVPILFVVSSVLGGLSGIIVGSIFSKRSTLAAMIGGFLVAFFLSFGMALNWYIRR
jgi:hypothetical protein